jgi:hypothetical protein
MRLRRIVDLAKATELKQIVIGEDDKQIIDLLNLALIDVYSQFDILEEEIEITLQAGKTRYTLPDNCMRVTAVFRVLEGEEYPTSIPLNDIQNENSVFTPQPFVLHVPTPKQGEKISVIYLTEPPEVTLSNIDTLDFMVPSQLLEPILSYMSYVAYKSMNGDQNTENASRYMIYQRSCSNVRHRGLLNYSMVTNMKAVQRGFPAWA